MKRTLTCRTRERCCAGRLNKTVERLMVRAESLIMRAVSALCSIILYKSNAGERSSHTAGCLDIFAGQFRLTNHKHHVQSCHVNTNGNHICCKQDIGCVSFGFLVFLGIFYLFKLIQSFVQFRSGYTAGQFVRTDNQTSCSKHSVCRTNNKVLNVIVHQRGGFAQILQAIKVNCKSPQLVLYCVR